jgi:hypothetical protein
MIDILRAEEEYWRHRGRLQWILKRDANTKFLQAVANGRKRKCTIQMLKSDDGVVTHKLEIQELIYSFYRNLMGLEEPKLLGLQPYLWPSHSWVSDQENEDLLRSFTKEELDLVLKETKTDIAPGSDGFPFLFYKQFWPILGERVL